MRQQDAASAASQRPQQMFAGAKPKLMSRAGPMAGAGKNFDMYAPSAFSSQALTQDPYREYKAVPQNLMYDRRVVRGNTFAALVIPVNMQADASARTKSQQMKRRTNFTRGRSRTNQTGHGTRAKMGQMGMAQEQDPQSVYESAMDPNQMQQDGQMQMDGQPAFDMQVHPRAQTAQPGSREMQYVPVTDLIELNDYHNMIDEQMIEPDYFIDMPPPAIYVPDAPGLDKETFMDERRDPDLFDFNAEVEPILQVLVGKTLEHARIEVIEEHEKKELQKKKDKFKVIKEAMLVKTQQMEASYERRVYEINRRVLQQKVTEGL